MSDPILSEAVERVKALLASQLKKEGLEAVWDADAGAAVYSAKMPEEGLANLYREQRYFEPIADYFVGYIEMKRMKRYSLSAKFIPEDGEKVGRISFNLCGEAQ